MRVLTHQSRRQFGILLGANLLAVALAGRGIAHNGPHVLNVSIKAFRFDPTVLTIRPGDSVEWVNWDIAPHTATDMSGAWDTGMLARGDRKAVTFDTPGEHAYLCAFHPHMVGRIIVSDRAPA